MSRVVFSFQLLELTSDDCYLDAAGGIFTYAGNINAKRRIISDIDFDDELSVLVEQGVELAKASSSGIPLPSGSVDKISCHHSFEHFQNNVDVKFVNEVQRMLAPGGKCVILPLFVAEKHLCVSDNQDFSFWDEPGSMKVVDKTATLPGGDRCGNFIRVYSPAAFKERVLNAIDPNEFDTHLFSLQLDGERVPNERMFMKREHALINHGYIALMISRKTKNADVDEC